MKLFSSGDLLWVTPASGVEDVGYIEVYWLDVCSIPQEGSDGHLLSDCRWLKLMHCGIQNQHYPHGVHPFDMEVEKRGP